MKTLIVLFTFMSLNAHARYFSENTQLPTDLQSQVIEALFAKFPCIAGMREMMTTETVKKEDQIRDYYYQTSFKVSAIHNSEPPHSLWITVESGLIAVNGVTPIVFNVESTTGNFCQ